MLEEYIKEYFPVLASWALGCGAAFSMVHTIKLARRDAGAPKPPAWLCRTAAFVIAFGVTAMVALRLFKMPYDVALIHGALIGMMYPVIMTAVMSYAKAHYPAFYDKLRVGDTRRVTDVADPAAPVKSFEDTQEF